MVQNKCKLCGANLDAGEKCDCRKHDSDKTYGGADYYIKPQEFTIDDALVQIRAMKSILVR